MLKLPPNRGALFAALLTLAGPIALQNMLGSALNLVDNVMIGSLGAKNIAGVALANQIFFLMILFMFAIGSGTAIFTAQYWGKKEIPAIRHSLGLCLLVMEAGALLFFAAAQIMPERLIGIFSPDAEVVAIGARFLRIMSWGFLLQGISMAYVNVLRSLEMVRLTLVASGLSLLLNTFLNWLLIFGNMGLPALGVEGAAIATVTARLVEMSIIVGAVYLRRPGGARHILAATPRELLGFSGAYVRKFFKVSWPVIGNELGWALGFTVPTIVFAHMGTDAIAAYNIADTAIKLVLVVFFGTTTANAVMVGKRIGAGDDEGAYTTANFFALIAPAMGASMGLILAGCSLFVPLFFNVTPQVREWAAIGMVIFAIDMPIRMFNWHVIVGILRAGGDTRFSMILDVGGTWFVSVPLCALAGLVLGAPFWIVYAATLVEDIPKFFMGIWRLRKRTWLNNLTHHTDDAGVAEEAQP